MLEGRDGIQDAGPVRTVSNARIETGWTICPEIEASFRPLRRSVPPVFRGFANVAAALRSECGTLLFTSRSKLSVH